MITTVVPFRFEAETHTYYDATGLVVPHITGLLERGGWIDDRWYTEESSARGRLVHTLTADYDLGAVDVKTCISRGRPYLLAHVECLRLEPPTFEEIEEPWVHPGLRFGGRPDRAGRLRSGARVVWEIKSGGKAQAHSIQTALQAILLEAKYGLPAEMWVRLCEYLDHRGRCKLVDHKKTQAADFAEARRLLYQYGGNNGRDVGLCSGGARGGVSLRRARPAGSHVSAPRSSHR